MRITINDYIDVTLSEFGRKIVAEKPHLLWRDLPDGRVRFQLWCAMNVFGPSCSVGEPSPFLGPIDVVLAE